jgi:pyrroline-5-carboxylate reductase
MSFTIGLIGCGNLGCSILQGYQALKSPGKAQFLVLETSRAQAKRVSEKYRITLAGSLPTLVRQADLILVCVKPKDAPALFAALPSLKGKVLLSAVSGFSIDQIYQAVKGKPDIGRVMPSLAIRVRAGLTGFYTKSVDAADYSRKLFSPLGEIFELTDEDHIQIVTALGASAPAFLALALEGMADGAVKMGIPKSLALALTLQMTAGATRLLQEEKISPDLLRNQIATPAGTTIHGLHLLEKAGVKGAFMSAVEAATLRARALAKK